MKRIEVATIARKVAASIRSISVSAPATGSTPTGGRKWAGMSRKSTPPVEGRAAAVIFALLASIVAIVTHGFAVSC